MTLNQPLLRYAAVTVAGLIVDLGVAILLVYASLSPPLASAAGLVVAAAFNFLLHRTWTFRDALAQPMLAQMAGYLTGLSLTTLVRMGTLAVLSVAIPVLAAPMALAAAIGVSFFINFVFLKTLVFRERTSS
jgi:putative flippase GtrA